MGALGNALLTCEWSSSKLSSFKCGKLNLQADATSLDLKECGLGPGAAVLLSAVIPTLMGVLKTLVLARNSIKDDGAVAIGEHCGHGEQDGGRTQSRARHTQCTRGQRAPCSD